MMSLHGIKFIFLCFLFGKYKEWKNDKNKNKPIRRTDQKSTE